jgi:O-antigen biosynthesis protein
VCRNAADPETLSELARQCKASATPIVFDLDDDLMNVPAAKDPGGVYPPFAPAMRELLAVASMTTVSTEPLLELYQARTDNAVLVPNRLDPRHWSVAVDPTVEIPEALREPRTGPRILYMGSPTHQEDLDMVLPAFERLRAEFGATLYIIGVIRGGDAPEGVVPLKPPNARYDQFIGWFRAVAPHFDVAIAPLTDASFNRAKSALKFMEYAAAGVPVVASRVIPYDGMVRDGVDGLLADADADAWVDAITSLVQEPDLRRQLSEAAKLRAREEFICQSCVFDELPWQAWREQLRAADPGRREAAQ